MKKIISILFLLCLSISFMAQSRYTNLADQRRSKKIKTMKMYLKVGAFWKMQYDTLGRDIRTDVYVKGAHSSTMKSEYNDHHDPIKIEVTHGKLNYDKDYTTIFQYKYNEKGYRQEVSTKSTNGKSSVKMLREVIGDSTFIYDICRDGEHYTSSITYNKNRKISKEIFYSQQYEQEVMVKNTYPKNGFISITYDKENQILYRREEEYVLNKDGLRKKTYRIENGKRKLETKFKYKFY